MDDIIPADADNRQIPAVIVLRALTVRAHIGIDAAELDITQPLTLDIEIVPAADPKDDQTPTVNYRAVADAVRDFAAQSRIGLMETFAAQCAQLILEKFAAAEVRLYCRKPKPFADLAEAGVEIRRRA